ncbi:MAG TPA: amidohydrolase family protein [Thermoanaerobaculia bacterium]|jgi:imidazolonepropionase-like amidohydrolase|nr:amidohydrolase family protein [Thermoanaerobaculia bacterium]
MSRRFLCFSSFILLFLVALPGFADAPGVYAITGGTVHPVSGPEIPNGVVIIRDGLIEAVGSAVVIPLDAMIIDVKGAHVYPGLIDAQTSLGFPSASAPRRRGGGGGGARNAPPEQLPETGPAFLAFREAKISDDDVDAKRATGVTTIVTAPAFGIFNGQSVALNLDDGRGDGRGGGTMESRVIRNPAAQQISFNPRPAWTYPDSLMGVISYIRQTLMDAQQHAAAHAIYDKNPAGYKRPDESPSLDALGGVLRRDVPVVFVADSDLMMRRAEAIAKEFNVRMIIAGARQGYRMAEELKALGAPLLVSTKWPVAPTSKEDREEQPLRVIRDRQLAPTTPAVLAKSGVLFALVSGAGKTGDYLPGIRKAIENGLSADDALKATTLNPAKILGIDRQLGSLEHGKIANLVITDKPIFDKESKVKRIFVDGREAKVPAEDEKKKTGGAATTATTGVDGSWSFVVKSTAGDVSISAMLHVENGQISGTFSGDRGAGDIGNGTFDGTTVQFSIAGRGKEEAGDWVFHGTLHGANMEGTVSTTLGTFPFTGSRK